MTKLALLAYFILFLILLKIRSIKISRTWFVPIFALYLGVVGASLFGIFFNGVSFNYLTSDKSIPVLIIEAFNPFNGRGKVMYGGYLGSIVGIWLVNFITQQKSISILLDISAIAWSFFLFIWRIGCFLGGCCYGCPNYILGISFSNKSSAFRHLEGTNLVVNKVTVPLLPTQLISAAGNFAIFLFLLLLFCRNKTKHPYFYFFTQMFLYGIGRFTIEFFRIDPREFWGPLSMSQWISIVLVAASLIFFIKNRKEIAESFRNPSHNCRDLS